MCVVAAAQIVSVAVAATRAIAVSLARNLEADAAADLEVAGRAGRAVCVAGAARDRCAAGRSCRQNRCRKDFILHRALLEMVSESISLPVRRAAKP